VAGVLVRQDNVPSATGRPSEPGFPMSGIRPGGHVEPGESPAVALIRELGEELSIDVRLPAGDCRFRLSSDHFDLQVLIITEWVGEPVNRSPEEHDEVAWLSEPRAAALDPPHHSYPSPISEAFERLRLISSGVAPD
jgi:8-oxo-dGTP diphosphatase